MFPDSAELDTYFFLRYGDRIGNKLIAYYENTDGIVTGDNLIDLAKMVYDINARKWEHLFGVMQAEYNPIENTDFIETIVENTQNEASVDSTGSGSSTTGSDTTNKRWGLGTGTNPVGDTQSNMTGSDS